MFYVHVLRLCLIRVVFWLNKDQTVIINYHIPNLITMDLFSFWRSSNCCHINSGSWPDLGEFKSEMIMLPPTPSLPLRFLSVKTAPWSCRVEIQIEFPQTTATAAEYSIRGVEKHSPPRVSKHHTMSKQIQQGPESIYDFTVKVCFFLVSEIDYFILCGFELFSCFPFVCSSIWGPLSRSWMPFDMDDGFTPIREVGFFSFCDWLKKGFLGTSFFSLATRNFLQFFLLQCLIYLFPLAFE